MIKLNQSASQYLQLITGQNGAVVDVSYSDKSSADFLGDSQLTSIVTATTTTICDTPAASVVRYIDFIAITNTYTGNHTITVQQNSSATAYPIVKDLVMSVGDRLEYTHACGWRVVDSTGAIHTLVATPQVVIAAGKTFTVSNSVTIAGTDGVATTLPATAGTLALRTGEAAQTFLVSTATLGTHAVPLAQTVGRNLLRNASGWIYQRAVAATADDTYFSDGWYALTQTGTVLPSLLTDPEDGYMFGNRLTQSQAAAQRFGYAQIIEGKKCKHGRGSTGVFVPRVRVSTSQAVRYAILGWTGTVDTVTSDVVLDWTSASYTAGGFFLAANVSILAIGTSTPIINTWTSLPEISGALGSSFNNLIIMVWTEGTAAQNFTLDFDFNQAEISPVATSFEYVDYEDDFIECSKFLPVFKASGLNTGISAPGYFSSTTNFRTQIRYNVTPRIDPTGVTLSSGGAADFYAQSFAGGNQTPSAIAFSGTGGSTYGQLNCTVAATTAGDGGSLIFNSATGSIIFTGAEL